MNYGLVPLSIPRRVIYSAYGVWSYISDRLSGLSRINIERNSLRTLDYLLSTEPSLMNSCDWRKN